MTVAPSVAPFIQPAPLDLSVDLSVPNVYSGGDFTLYLHITNPFPVGVKLEKVELSLPTQLSWRDSVQAKRNWRNFRSDRKISKLLQELSTLDDKDQGSHRAAETILADISAVQRAQRSGGLASRAPRIVNAIANGNSDVSLGDINADGINLYASSNGAISIGNIAGSKAPARVPLEGSLPNGAILQPGSTDVWNIRLGSSKNPFFMPAEYRLQLTVIYELDTPPG